MERVLTTRLDSLAVHVHSRAELTAIEVSEQGSIAGPDLNAPLLQRQELLLLVEEDKGLGRGERRRLTGRSVLTIDDL